MNISNIYIYRMTHIKNISHILEYGITHKDSPNSNPDYVSIGDISLISTRETKQVNISNGDRSQSFGNIVLGKFIPFYYGVRMPMLYVMQHGGNYVESATPPEDIIYLVCKLTDIIQSGIVYYFSDGHAIDAFSLFYDSSEIAKLPTIIDWTAVKSWYWSGKDNLELKRKMQAEFLVENDIPVQYLIGFYCYSETVKQQLITMDVDKNKIKVSQQAYY